MTDKRDFLPFALPDIGQEEIDEVVDSLRTGWLTMGPKVKRFEEDFAEFLGSGIETVAVSSATAGLHLALEAVGVGPGDEVVTTPYTFTATGEVIRYLGADPVFVDIDPGTFNIDPNKIEQAISARLELRGKVPKAIMAVHFGGLACDMDAIGNTARRFGLKVVEDSAHALPASYRGKLVGTLNSSATVFSFYATKAVTTGEGGMVVTKDSRIADHCRTMRLHGISRDPFERHASKGPSWYYEVVAPGYKYNMTDLAASLGIHQLKKAWKFRERREEIAGIYDDAFKDLPLVLPPGPLKGDFHARHLYVIRLKDEAKVGRNRFIERMFEMGIACSVHFIPLHFHSYWKDRYGLKPEDFPEATKAYERAVSLPVYTRMSGKDQERVITAVREILE